MILNDDDEENTMASMQMNTINEGQFYEALDDARMFIQKTLLAVDGSLVPPAERMLAYQKGTISTPDASISLPEIRDIEQRWRARIGGLGRFPGACHHAP